MKLFRADCLAGQLLPAAAMNQYSAGQVKNFTPLFQTNQLFIKILPYHKGKSKKQNLLPPVLFQKGFHSFHIQFHIIVQSI